ncbi:MAG: protein translocase subunit SecF [Alphaproteobacteria bacterium]
MIGRLYPLRLIPERTNINFMGKRWISFTLSILMMIMSIGLIFSKGLNFGIDFTGGILIEARSSTPVDIAKMRYVLSNLNLGEVALQTYGSDQDLIIRVGVNKSQSLSDTKSIEAIKTALSTNFQTAMEYRKIDYVGPQIGAELIKNGILATIFSFIAIMIYISFRFEWQYGVGLLCALVHDAIVTIGFISLTNLEFNLTSIAAILTIIGYSVNDSVVIYDRIRENVKKPKKLNLYNLLNISINETLSRTILTVMTTLLSTLALILFGGEAIKSFSIVMFFGIIIGTYSSIYISAPILIYLEKK